MRRIAADGKPFDIDNLGRPTYDGEVEIIQYLRPNGLRRRMTCPCREDIIAKAAGLIIEAEDLGNGSVAIWVRGPNENEEHQMLDIANNGTGDRNPVTILERLIDRKFEQLVTKDKNND